MPAAIEAVELRKRYPPAVQALDGISLSVEAGTIFGVLGPNGAEDRLGRRRHARGATGRPRDRRGLRGLARVRALPALAVDAQAPNARAITSS